jgi:hypothetical protein
MLRGPPVAVAAALCGALLVAHLADATDAAACAPAPPPGAEVQITEEEAVILWDPATRTEHFIRRAAFRSTAPAFGFLVPTPTTPALGEIDAGVFGALAELLRPEVRYEEVRRPRLTTLVIEGCRSGLMGASKGGDGLARAPAVRELATARVAGFDATTLEADQAGALAGWLDRHGFATTPELTAWLERYS